MNCAVHDLTSLFQTLYVEPTVLLCDCPGLVMPTFVSTKADMVVSGILPIDQMRDYVPPVSLVSFCAVLWGSRSTVIALECRLTGRGSIPARWA